jgi:hypothetical protein
MKLKRAKFTLWIARLFITIVTFWNLQCAAVFLVKPAAYAPGFELSGAVGSAMVQALGLLFVMWNVPYVFALIHPLRFHVSLIEAVIMQGLGALGETVLLFCLPGSHPILHSSVIRFIIFDGSGFLLLLIALLLILRIPKTEKLSG